MKVEDARFCSVFLISEKFIKKLAGIGSVFRIADQTDGNSPNSAVATVRPNTVLWTSHGAGGDANFGSDLLVGVCPRSESATGVCAQN